MDFKYSVNLFWSEEDDCYVATIPEFPGLSAFGETPEEAAAEARIAAEGFVKVYEEDGCKLPKPRHSHQFSGQFRIRLPKSLHASLSQEAQNEGVSLNQHIVYLLSERNLANTVNETLHDLKTIAAFEIYKHATVSTPSTKIVEVSDLVGRRPTYKTLRFSS